MTLFGQALPEPSGFQAVLTRYFEGEADATSLRLLAARNEA